MKDERIGNPFYDEDVRSRFFTCVSDTCERCRMRSGATGRQLADAYLSGISQPIPQHDRKAEMFQSMRSGSMLLGLLVSRVVLATDIPSPASVNEAVTPILRLNQTGDCSIPPYQWDVRGNENIFAVVDENVSTFPFVINAGTPDFMLVLDHDNVGIGTTSPAAGLHLKKLAQAAAAEIMARFETTDDPIGGLFIANNSAGDGVFIPKILGRSGGQNAALIHEAVITNDLGSSPAIAFNAVKGAGGALATRPLVVYRNNSVAKVTIAANGNVTATSFNPVSSRALKHDIKDLDSEKASDALRQLTPVQFVYNDDESAEERVGFIAEDVPELVANKDRQTVPIMDVVALMTRVLKDQDRLNEQQQKTIDDQQKTIDGLIKRLQALESLATKVEEEGR